MDCTADGYEIGQVVLFEQLDGGEGAEHNAYLVAGAECDAIVDAEATEETARFCGVEPRVLRGLPHDVMLAKGWESAADEVAEWCRAL